MRQRATVPSTAPNDFEEIGGHILTPDDVGSDMCVRSRLDWLGIEFDDLFLNSIGERHVVFIHPQSPLGQEKSHLDLPQGMLDVCFDTTGAGLSLIVNGVTKRYPDICSRSCNTSPRPAAWVSRYALRHRPVRSLTLSTAGCRAGPSETWCQSP
jgi:hypothetical protein